MWELSSRHITSAFTFTIQFLKFTLPLTVPMMTHIKKQLFRGLHTECIAHPGSQTLHHEYSLAKVILLEFVGWSSHIEANKYFIINKDSPLMGNSETEPEKWHSQTCSQWTLSPLHEYLQETYQPHQAMRESHQEKAVMLIDNRYHKIWLGSNWPHYV